MGTKPASEWRPGQPVPDDFSYPDDAPETSRLPIIAYDGPSQLDPDRPFGPGGEFGPPAAAGAAAAPAPAEEVIDPPREAPPMIMRVEHLEEHGVTSEELHRALEPVWRELDRILAQLGLHRSR